jgi:hypothetical protein
MTTVYYYPISDDTNINAKVTLLDSKLLIDLEIPNYTSSVYNTGTQYLEVTYSAPLDYLPVNTLNNLVNILIYDGVLGQASYYNDFNIGVRRTFGVSTAPTIYHDGSDGYDIGSMVITTDNVIYMCTNNSSDAAVWVQISPA